MADLVIIAIRGRFADLLQVPGLHPGRTETKQALHRVASVIYACPGARFTRFRVQGLGLGV